MRFSINLELICTCELLKKLKLHSQKSLVQFHGFEKLTCANIMGDKLLPNFGAKFQR